MKTQSIASVLLSLLLVVNVAAADLSEVLGSIDVERDVARNFDELRMSPKLRAPVAVKGTMMFTGEGTMIKTVTEPFSESVTISQHTITFARGKKSRSVSLDAKPGLAAFYSGLRALLSADVVTLEALFDSDVASNGESGGWTVRLSPKDEGMSEFASLMTVVVVDSDVRAVRVEQESGAWQEMVLAPTAP